MVIRVFVKYYYRNYLFKNIYEKFIYQHYKTCKTEVHTSIEEIQKKYLVIVIKRNSLMKRPKSKIMYAQLP